MTSVNDDRSTVLKGIRHGARDYLLKPVRVLEIKNIWQHVVRKNLFDSGKPDVKEEKLWRWRKVRRKKKEEKKKKKIIPRNILLKMDPSGRNSGLIGRLSSISNFSTPFTSWKQQIVGV